MTPEAGDVPVIEIDPRVDHVQATRSRPLPAFAPVVTALILGILLGIGTTHLYDRANPSPVPAPAMHTVVVTEDGRSETYTMPSGSVVTTPAVAHSCSITIDGKFVDTIFGVVGNAECGATVR